MKLNDNFAALVEDGEGSGEEIAFKEPAKKDEEEGGESDEGEGDDDVEYACSHRTQKPMLKSVTDMSLKRSYPTIGMMLAA